MEPGKKFKRYKCTMYFNGGGALANRTESLRQPIPHSRPIVQGIFLILFLILFSRAAYPFSRSLIDNFFFRFDPLVALVMALTGTALTAVLLFSAIMVVVTVLFGRVFCGWVCPMGTVFDLASRIIPSKPLSRPFGHGRYKNVKYYGFMFLIVGALFGFSAFLFFDPLVFLFRVFTLNVYPFSLFLANLGLNLVRPAATMAGWYGMTMLSYEQPVYALGLANLMLFGVVVGLIALERRFWCRNLCPLGALLALLSRFAVRGRKVSDACINCSKCARACPMNAIGDDFHETSLRECIQCERCTPVCPVGAISFGSIRPGSGLAFNPSRRRLLAAGTGGALAGLAAGSAASTKVTAENLLRPPGALIEADFLDACLRCGECMKICPTHGLQPAIFQSGFEGLFTPVLTPRIGACEEQCNLCGQICPTGAVRSLSLEEKQYATIGNAVIERQRCIAWEQGKVCLICDEVCPYDAVEFRMVTDDKRPFVIEEKCVGCGQCEHGCPVNGPAAIRVSPVNEVRKNTGGYKTERVAKLREVDQSEQANFSGDSAPSGYEEGAPAVPEPSPDDMNFDNDVPSGFN